MMIGMGYNSSAAMKCASALPSSSTAAADMKMEYPSREGLQASMSIYHPISSALPPREDIPGGVAEGPFLTLSRHFYPFAASPIDGMQSENRPTK